MLNKETIIVSDINIDFKDRKNYDKHRLAKGLRGMHFKQLVDFITRPVSKTCLDHVYCNQPQRINLVTSGDIGLSDHLPVFVVRKYAREHPNKKCSRIKYRDMKSFDEDLFKQSLKSTPWESVFVFEEIDDIVYAWEELFNNALNDHCPWREKRVKYATQPPWMSNAVIKRLHSRDRLLKVARNSDNSSDWAYYREARNKAVSALRSAKREFYKNAFDENRNNPKATWNTIKTLAGSGRMHNEISNLNLDGRAVENAAEIAEQFNLYFSTIAENLRAGLSNIPSDLSKLVNFVESRKDPGVLFSVPEITSAQVLQIIKNIRAAGIDKISARFLRIAAPIVAQSIAKIINISFSTGKFPARWKTAYVTPLFKQGVASDPSNYRPISVLPVVSKVIERHMHNSLYCFLMENNLIYSRQSGFRKMHSTETALINLIDELLFSLDNNKVSGMVLVDYRKAFDMVDHRLLLHKLELYGIADQELSWCRSYLSDRKQVVRVKGNESSEASMLHGVPQGSILGPLFFILFINDLPLHISAQIDLYADDTTVTASADVKALATLNSSLNKSVSEIQLWASANKLPLNEDKTKVLMISGKRQTENIKRSDLEVIVNDKQLSIVHCATLLGVEIDSKLSFYEHVEKVCKKLASRIAILRKIRACLPLNQRLQYYNSVIRPIMSYANVIWASCDKELLYRIFKLQKRAARVVCYADRLASSVALFNMLGWIPFYEQHKIDKCALMYKRVNGMLPNYLNDHLVLNNKRHSRDTRYATINAVCPKYKRETEGGRSFAVTATKLWNNLPLHTRKLDSVTCLKKNMFARIFKEQLTLKHFVV